MKSWEGNMNTVKERQNISVLMGFEPWCQVPLSVELQCQDAPSMGDIQSLKSEGHIQSPMCEKPTDYIAATTSHEVMCHPSLLSTFREPAFKCVDHMMQFTCLPLTDTARTCSNGISRNGNQEGECSKLSC